MNISLSKLKYVFRLGEEFDLMDGVIGMALSPLKGPLIDRILYFHALASITENYVKTSVLRNASAWDGISTPNARDFKVFKKTHKINHNQQKNIISIHTGLQRNQTIAISSRSYGSIRSTILRAINTLFDSLLEFSHGIFSEKLRHHRPRS